MEKLRELLNEQIYKSDTIEQLEELDFILYKTKQSIANKLNVLYRKLRNGK